MMARRLWPAVGLWASAAAAACVGGRLVIHAGPHKTGTTSVQRFLEAEGAWLAAAFGVRALDGAAAPGGKVARKAPAARAALRALLAANATVVVSSESLGGPRGLAPLAGAVRDACAAVAVAAGVPSKRGRRCARTGAPPVGPRAPRQRRVGAEHVAPEEAS